MLPFIFYEDVIQETINKYYLEYLIIPLKMCYII